ncbi:HEPN domain-containing protein [Candidatus Bathyarchaeota archaeon]|nr:HEPN domain-containing protein [Candidatus Bathyarchaeota archaeon]
MTIRGRIASEFSLRNTFRSSFRKQKTGVKEILDKYLLELSVLEDAYMTSGYIMREFTKQEVEKLAKSVKEIMKDVT